MDADHLLALDKIKNWSKSAATSLQNRLAIFISQRHAQRRCSKYKRREATAVLQLFYVPDSKTKTICYEKGLFEQVEPIQKAGKSPKSILDGHWAATQKAIRDTFRSINANGKRQIGNEAQNFMPPEEVDFKSGMVYRVFNVGFLI